MNKQELIKKFEEIGIYDLNLFGTVVNSIPTKTAISLIKQLDEPEKVKVSEEEAKFLKTFNFSHHSDVTKALYYVSRTGFCYYLTDNFDIELKGLSEGFRDLENRKRLIRAILDGYEVEEEKRYRISMPKTRNYMNNAQFLCEKDGKIFWCGEWHPFRTKFTRKELEEAGFGWVFDCPGIEIEEVEG